VYVFCLLTGEDHESTWLLELDHWRLYVVPRGTVDMEFGDQKTVSLSRVQAIADEMCWADIRGG
jgi:hypothetical protein